MLNTKNEENDKNLNNYVPEAEAIHGYKGFDINDVGGLQCRDFEYKQGRIYVTDNQPVACSKGFHFCRGLNQVFEFYPVNNKTVYHKVRAWGKIDEQQDKLAASHIEILEKVSDNEVFIIQLIPHMNEVDKILEDNPNTIIAGSLALILLGLLPYRMINDIDITVPFFGGFNKAKVDNSFGKSGIDTIQMNIDHILFDVFVNPKNIFVEIEFCGKKYKVSDFKPILEAKFRYMLAGKYKHSEDIILVIKKLQELSAADVKESSTKEQVEFGEKFSSLNFKDVVCNHNTFVKKYELPVNTVLYNGKIYVPPVIEEFLF